MSEATRFARQPHFYHTLTVTPTAPPFVPVPYTRHSREKETFVQPSFPPPSGNLRAGIDDWKACPVFPIWFHTRSYAKVSENGNLDSADLVIQICPRGISPLNQFNLPWPIPFLERLLPTDGAFHGSMDFVPDQPVYSISLRKSFHEIISVAPYTLHKIGCHSDI